MMARYSAPQSRKPRYLRVTGLCMGSLAVTYFRERKLTIIGALLFHGPVRDGKGWVQQAIAAKRNLCATSHCVRRSQIGGEGCLL